MISFKEGFYLLWIQVNITFFTYSFWFNATINTYLQINSCLRFCLFFTEKQGLDQKSFIAALPASVLLKELHEEIKSRNDEFHLNITNLNQALMERLSSPNLPLISYRTNMSQTDAISPANEPSLIKYLAHSFRRLTDELSVLKRRLKVYYWVCIKGILYIYVSLIQNWAFSKTFSVICICSH